MRILLSLFILVLSLAGVVVAQAPSPSPGETVDVVALRQRLEEVQRRLLEAPPMPATSGLRARGEAPPYLASLRRYDATLRRLITVIEGRDRLHADLETVVAALQKVTTTGIEEPRPYTVDLLDDLQGQLDIVAEQNHSVELAMTAAKTSRELEAAQFHDYKALRRRLLDRQTNDPSDVALRRQIENTGVAIEASEAAVKLAQAELVTSELEIGFTKTRGELLRLKLTLVQESFRFSIETLETQIKKLEESRTELTQELKQFKSAQEVSQGRLTSLQIDDIDDEEQTQEFEARIEWVKTHQRRGQLLEERLEFNILRRDLWERRFLAHAGQHIEKYDEWEDSTTGLLVRLSKNREVLESELSQTRSQLAELLDTTGEDAETDMSKWAEVRAQALIKHQKALEENINHQSETRALAKRLLAEFALHQKAAPLSERFGQAWGSLIGFWNIELYTLGDSAVTVGKLSIAITILVLGIALVGRFTKIISHRFLRVLPMRENVRVNLERFLRYILILLVFLFSLHVVNIPLTIFKFLGGTLAIAVGFGAKNILNNFISGLILMVERPVRVGDMIQVEDTIGVIEEIGARSTRVRMPTGIHVILPNSTLLENKVVNWTLQDKTIRANVCVGVAYGSPVRKVIELINQAANDTERVKKTPAPVVIFDEFGDSSLNFTIHFWVTVEGVLDRDEVNTQIRLAIDDLFREHDISIPFPQRDLNFNSPVPVRVVTPEEEPKKESP